MPEKITKIVRQYSRLLSAEDINLLWEIAGDYAAVKNYVYDRYCGVKSLPKLYQGYTVQNEMTRCGLRGSLGLPSIYFYLAVFDALGDIKASWKLLRKKAAKNAARNENFNDLEKYYVRYMLKSDYHFCQIVLRKNFRMPEPFLHLETARLDNYICRQVRKYKFQCKTKRQNIFQVSPKGYVYQEGGIALTTKIPRKRLFVPLTDKNQYKRQLVVELKDNRLVLYVPVESRIHLHTDYIHEVGLAFGYFTMFTSSTCRTYGERYGELQGEETQRLHDIQMKHQMFLNLYKKHLENGKLEKAKNIETNNLGRKKYIKQKEKAAQCIKAYINAEINRMLREEKAAVIYIPKLPSHGKGYSKNFNEKLSSWQKGYIKERLAYKCSVHSIKLQEVNACGIGRECSVCGGTGYTRQQEFICEACGNTENRKTNAAKVVLKRGQQLSNI